MFGRTWTIFRVPRTPESERIDSCDGVPEPVAVRLPSVVDKRVNADELPGLRVVVAADPVPEARELSSRHARALTTPRASAGGAGGAQ